MYIFDIDGTLLDTIDTISYYINKAFSDFDLGQVPRDEVRKNVGNGPVVLVDKCLDYLNARKDEYFRREVLNHYNKIYDDNPSYKTHPYEGIRGELDSLKKAEEIIVAFSNKPDSTSKKVLGEVFGKNYFDMILGYKEGIKRKPSPEGIMIIAERFGKKMTDIVYFGDSEVDIKCGKNAGVFTVACAWGFREKSYLLEQKPDFIIDTPGEIRSIRRI